MSLPSRYASDGLSERDQSRVLTVGTKRSAPIEYTLRTNTKDNRDQDIQMSSIDDRETDIITSFINYSRNKNVYYNDVSIEQKEVILGGNTSLLVIDTNFLISQLSILEEIDKLAVKYKLKIIIPLYVIKELDGLKNSKGNMSTNVPLLARLASNWIYNKLANLSDIVMIQRSSQMVKSNLVKDEAILDCCLYFKQHYLTVLFSNDKNLCTLALSNEVLTISFTKDMNANIICERIYQENIERYGIESEKKLQTQIVKSSAKPSKEWVEKTRDFQFQAEAEVIDTLYNEIQTVLLSALHHCMEKEYGEDLDLVRDYDKSSIVTLNDCSFLIIRFWFVFRGYFKTPPFEEKGNRKIPVHVDYPSDNQEAHEFTNFWSGVLTTIYDQVMNETEQTALNYLIERWNEMSKLIN